MRAARERPRVAFAVVLVLVALVAITLLVAGGGADEEQLGTVRDSAAAANRRAVRAERTAAESKARIEQLVGELRRTRATAASAGRRANAATRRSRQLRAALTRERRRR